MSLYLRLAGSQLGSSALFGACFLATFAASEGLAAGLEAGALAAVSWFAIVPLVKRLAGGEVA